MKQIYTTILLLFLSTIVWGQQRRLDRLPDGTLYNNSKSGLPATTNQSAIDSLAGIQSYPDRSSLLLVSPPIGHVLEDRLEGVRYLVIGDTIAGLPIDDVYQTAITGGKYIIKTTPHVFTFNNTNVGDSVTQAIAGYTRNFVYKLSISSNQDYGIYLPSVDSVSTETIIKISAEDSSSFDYFIQPAEGIMSLGSGNNATIYWLDDNEEIELRHNGTYWRIVNSNYNSLGWENKPRLMPYVNYDSYKSDLLPTGITYTPDSVTVIKKRNKTPWGENRIKRSSDLSQTPFWNNVTNRVSFTRDIAVAPDGTYSVDRVVPIHATAPRFRFNPATGGSGATAYNLFEPNTTYTLSLWAKVQPGDVSWIYPTITNTTISTNIDTFHVDNTYLIRRSWTFTTNGSIDPQQSITFDIAPGNDIDVWNFQLERTPQASPDIVTGYGNTGDNNFIADRDTVYLSVQPVKGVLYTSQAKNIFGFDDNVVVQKQMNYGLTLPNCHEVNIDQDVYFKAGIIVPENFGLSGSGDRHKVYANLTDTNGYVIQLGEDAVQYNNGISLKDVWIEGISPARAGLYYFGQLETQIENVTITGTSDMYFNYGIYEPFLGNRSIAVDINRLIINGVDTAFYTTMQATSSIRDLTIRNNTKYGIIMPSNGGFTAYKIILEQIDSAGIIVNNGDIIEIHQLRIEDVPNISNVQSTIRINKARSFTIYNSNLGPTQEYTIPTPVIYLDSVDYAMITGSKMDSRGAAPPVATTANTGELWWIGNSDVAEYVDTSYIHPNTLFYYFDDENGNAFIPRQIINDADLNDSYFNAGEYDGSTKFFTDSITLIGSNNQLKKSQSIVNGTYWSNSSNSVVFTGGQTDPNAGTTASKVVWLGNNNRFVYNPTLLGTAFEWQPDTWYNISFHAALINGGDSTWIYPDIDNVSFVSQDTAFITTTSDGRYNWQFKTNQNIAADANIRFNIAPRDSFLFYFPQLSLGRELKTYLPTTTSENIPATGSTFVGNMTVTGDFIADPGYFLKTGTTSTTTDGSGQVVVAHGLGIIPTSEFVQIVGTPYWTQTTSDATNLTVTFIDDTTGLPAASVAVNFNWLVIR